MANLTPAAKGAALTFTSAAGGGDTILTAVDSGKHYRLYVANADSVDHTVTLADVGPCNRGYVHSSTGARAITCAHGKTTQIDIDSYEIDPTTGHVAVTYSAVTTQTVAAAEI